MAPHAGQVVQDGQAAQFIVGRKYTTSGRQGQAITHFRGYATALRWGNCGVLVEMGDPVEFVSPRRTFPLDYLSPED